MKTICQLCGEQIMDDKCVGNDEDGFIHNECIDNFNEDATIDSM